MSLRPGYFPIHSLVQSLTHSLYIEPLTSACPSSEALGTQNEGELCSLEGKTYSKICNTCGR